MHAVSDNAISQRSLAAPSIATYRASETVLSAGYRADVHAVEELKFHVASTAALLMQDPAAISYVAAERREDRANCAPLEMKPQVQDGQLSWITRKVIDKIEESLAGSGGNLIYAGYPYDPFVVDTVE
jgi:hypothetical protein